MRFIRVLSAVAAIALLAVSVFVSGDLFKGLTCLFLGLAALDSFAAAVGWGNPVLAAVGGSFANLTGGLMRRYDKSFLGQVVWKTGPLASMLSKKAWSGEMPVWPIQVGVSPATSATFADAKSKSEDATYGFTRIHQFVGAWVKDYGRATVEGLLMRASSDNMGGFYDKFVAQIDGILAGTAHSFATKVYRDGYGCIGNISAGTNVATTALTLAVREDVYLFEVGMSLQFAASNAADALRNSGGALVVTAINHTTGTLIMSAAINSVTGTVAGDFIFKKGDREDSATPTRRALTGLDAWMPTAQPSNPTTFKGVNVGADGRLIGTIIDATSLSEEESFIDAAVEAVRISAKPRFIFTNPTRYGNVIKQSMGRYRPTMIKGPAGLGFPGAEVDVKGGVITVMPDVFCPRKRSYMLEMDTWTIWGPGSNQFPGILMHDGNKILRTTDDDAVECRAGYYGDMGCNAPINNSVIKHEA